MNSLIVADSSVNYSTKEVAIIVVALVWILAIGGAAAVSVFICGWHRTKQLAVDWLRGRVIFYCN